jgi:hypothetical protein
MSSASPLAYYTDDKSQPRRPRELTTVAITGIVLAALLLFAQTFAAPSASQRMGSGAGLGGSQSFSIGFALGRLVAISFALLMLIGCCGLLWLRWMARLMVWIAAYAWIALGALSILLLAYSQFAMPSSAKGAGPALIAMALVQVAAQIGFAVWAMMIVRRADIAALFTHDPQPAPPLPAILKLLAVITLVYAALALLQALIEMVGLAAQVKGFDNLHTARLLPLNPYGFGAVRFLDLFLAMALNAGFVCGCIFVLLNRGIGARVIAICCFARLAFTIGLWTSDNYTAALFGAYGSKSALADVYRVIWAFSVQVSSLMFPGLLLAIFTYRLPSAAAAASLPAAAAAASSPTIPAARTAPARAPQSVPARPATARPAPALAQAPQSTGRRPPPLKQPPRAQEGGRA